MDIGRRSVLAAIFGTPVAGMASDVVDASIAGPVGVPPEASNCISEASPFQRALQKARRDYEQKREARRVLAAHMPDYIATKKSWSPAFKSHVYANEAHEGNHLWNLDDDELAAFLIKRGFDFTGLSKED